jgi:hypothetical protein
MSARTVELCFGSKNVSKVPLLLLNVKLFYNLFCKGGKIDLKTYKKPPEPLCSLL